MLAVTLRQLWDRRTSNHAGLTFESYRALGGLSGVIAQTANGVLTASHLDELTRAALRDAFIGMVRIDRDGRIGRKPLERRGLTPRVREFLGRFEAQGLLVSSARNGYIELAHEALTRTWPVLAKWVDEAREDLLRLERFEMALGFWRGSPEALLEGMSLVEAEDLVARRYQAVLTDEATELVALSRRRRDLAAANELQRQQALRVSESLRLATEAREAVEREPATAMRVAWEAVLWDRNELSEAVFREALGCMSAPVKVVCRDAKLWRRNLEYATDGSFFCIPSSADFTGTRGGWIETRHRNGDLIARFTLPDEGAWSAAIAPNRRALLVGRAGRLWLLDPRGTSLANAPLTDWDRKHQDSECRLAITTEGTGVFQQGATAWVFELDSSSDALRIRRHMTWVTDVDTWDERLHQPLQNIFGMSLDGPRRRVLSYAGDGVRCWSLDSDSCSRLEGEGSDVGAEAAFLPDGRIVTGSLRGEGRIWASDGRLQTLFRPGAGADLFIPDVHAQYFITASNTGDHALEVWNAEGKLQALLDARGEHYWCAAFSPDGDLIAAGCRDGALRIWEWRERRLVHELHGHEGTARTVAFDPHGGSLVSGGDDGVRLWTLDAPILPVLSGHGHALHQMRRSGDRMLTVSDDDTTTAWTTQDETAALAGALIGTVSGGSLERVLTQDAGGRVRLWHWPDPARAAVACLCTSSARERIQSADISPDGRRFVLVTGHRNQGDAELWSADGERLGSLLGKNDRFVDEGSGIAGVGFHPSIGAVAVGAVNGMVWIWTADGKPSAKFVAARGSPDPLIDIAFDPLGEFLLVGVREAAVLWTWRGEELFRLPTRGYKVLSVAVSPNGQRILTMADNPGGSAHALVQLWDRRGQLLADLDVSGSYTSHSFDKDGRYLLLYAGDLRIYDEAGVLIGVLAGARNVSLAGFDVSPDGNRIAAQFTDGVARIWSLAERRRVMSIRTNSSGPIAFSADGRRLLAARPSSNAIGQHPIDIADLFAGAAERLDRGLSLDEVRRFAIPQPVKLRLAASTRG